EGFENPHRLAVRPGFSRKTSEFHEKNNCALEQCSLVSKGAQEPNEMRASSEGGFIRWSEGFLRDGQNEIRHDRRDIREHCAAKLVQVNDIVEQTSRHKPALNDDTCLLAAI